MKTTKTSVALAAIILTLLGGVAMAQPRDHGDDHRSGPPPAAHGPAMAPRPMENHRDNNFRPAPRPGFNGPRPGFNRPRPGFDGPRPGARHLPPGILAPRLHDRAPMWRGRSWAVGDIFRFSGFHGPTIYNLDDYGLPPARPGTHWIYVDGWYLMVGNRTGRIFDEVPADY